MESNVASNTVNSDVNKESASCGSSNVEDSFNMKSFEDSLPDKAGVGSKTEEDSDDEYSDAKDGHSDESDEELDLDDEAIAECHKDLSEDELQKLKDEAISFKSSGNKSFKMSDFKEAITLYTRALNTCPLKFQSDRSILYANRGAARIGIDKKEEAVLDCNKAIELNPMYLKALVRRAQLHKTMGNLERSLEDYQAILELDRNHAEARHACATLPDEITEKNEKLKAEMFGKLKELGNICLKPFGLSTENFKIAQDPNSGGYSINFQNNTS